MKYKVAQKNVFGVAFERGIGFHSYFFFLVSFLSCFFLSFFFSLSFFFIGRVIVLVSLIM